MENSRELRERIIDLITGINDVAQLKEIHLEVKSKLNQIEEEENIDWDDSKNIEPNDNLSDNSTSAHGSIGGFALSAEINWDCTMDGYLDF